MISSVLVYGFTNSVALALIALGFSLTFGISGVANFAYGGFYLFSGYLAWILLNQLGLSLPLAVLITVAATGVLGFITYWVILVRVRGIALSEVIATFALGVGMLELFRWMGFVRYEFNLPFFIKGGVEIWDVHLDYQRLFIIGIGLALILFLYLFTHHTRIGWSFRGIAQNERTAISLGIESDWAAALSLGIGSAMAALAAITILPLGIISINVGYDVLLIAVAIGIIGGLESIPGILVGSLILGYAQVITGMYLSPEWMMVVYLAAIVLVLIIKPSGLFGRFKELEERV
ncbi:MAG: branched-chain amino acid ABC transporter permease [Thermodesulfobacteriota bacterium]|nr:branched-chain amino acid ABC transporter permease [Thermodesulfobacteriota bacterium]